MNFLQSSSSSWRFFLWLWLLESIRARLHKTPTATTPSTQRRTTPQGLLPRHDHHTNNFLDRSPHRLVVQNNDNSSPRQNGLCWLNDQGLYGDANADRNNGAKAYIMNFLYQTSFDSGTSIMEIRNTILPEIDRAAVLAILADFFDCTEIQRRSLTEGTVQSISAMPLDELVPSKLTCPKTVANTECYIVQGYATIVASGVLDRSALEATFTAHLQTAFQDGSVSRYITAPEVKDVTYLTNALQTLPPLTETSTPVPTPAITEAPTISLAQSSESSSPTRRITFAPVRIPIPTDAATMAPTTRLMTTTPSNGTNAPTISPSTNTYDHSIRTVAPVTSPIAVSPSRPRDNNTKKKVAPWWVWLLTGIGAAVLFLVFLTLYDYVQERKAAASVRPDRPKQHRRSDDDHDEEQANGDGSRTGDLDGVYFPPSSQTVDQQRPGHFHIHEDSDEEEEEPSDSFVNGNNYEDEDDDDDYEDDGVDDIVEYQDNEDDIDEDDVYHAEDDEYLDQVGELEDFGEEENEGTATSYIEEEVSSETAFNLNVQRTKGFVTA